MGYESGNNRPQSGKKDVKRNPSGRLDSLPVISELCYVMYLRSNWGMAWILFSPGSRRGNLLIHFSRCDPFKCFIIVIIHSTHHPVPYSKI